MNFVIKKKKTTCFYQQLMLAKGKLYLCPIDFESYPCFYHFTLRLL